MNFSLNFGIFHFFLIKKFSSSLKSYENEVVVSKRGSPLLVGVSSECEEKKTKVPIYYQKTSKLKNSLNRTAVLKKGKFGSPHHQLKSSLERNNSTNNLFSRYIKNNYYQRSASRTGSPGSRGPGPGNLGHGLEPGLILKYGTGTGTQIQYLRYPGPGLDKICGTGNGTVFFLISEQVSYTGLKSFWNTVPVPCRPLNIIL